MVVASKVLFSLKLRLSVPGFVSQLWRKIAKAAGQIQNGMPGFEAIGKPCFVYCVNVLIGLVLPGTLVLKLVQATIFSELSIFYLIITWIQKCVFVFNTTVYVV